MHVQNGEIKYVETDNTGTDEYGHHQFVLVYVVALCAAVFTTQIAWNTQWNVLVNVVKVNSNVLAGKKLDEVAGTMQRLIKDYGNDTIYLNYGTGTLGGTVTKSWPPAQALIARLMNLSEGGYLNHYGDYST